MTFTGFMITFYLIYQSYPSSVSIKVTFNNSITGSYSASVPSLPSGYNEFGWVIPVTFY